MCSNLLIDNSVVNDHTAGQATKELLKISKISDTVVRINPIYSVRTLREGVV